MGTKGTVHIVENGRTILSIYRQMDSYPEGLGVELFEILNDGQSVIKNGFSLGDNSPKVFNGAQDLAAYVIGMLKLFRHGELEKNIIGHVYVSEAWNRQEYNYFIYADVGLPLRLRITNKKDEEIFFGFMKEFKAKTVRDIEIFKKALSNLSYYNAADSNWGDETAARASSLAEVRNLARNLQESGINPREFLTGYLVSESELGLNSSRRGARE